MTIMAQAGNEPPGHFQNRWRPCESYSCDSFELIKHKGFNVSGLGKTLRFHSTTLSLFFGIHSDISTNSNKATLAYSCFNLLTIMCTLYAMHSSNFLEIVILEKEKIS